MKNQKWRRFAAIFMVTAMLGTSVPNESNASILLIVNSKNQFDKSNHLEGIGSLAAGAFVGLYIVSGTLDPYDSYYDEDLSTKRKINLILQTAQYIGVLVLDEEAQPVKGAKASSFSIETLEMTYTPEEALQIHKDLVLLDQQEDKKLTKFPIPDAMEKKIKGDCDAVCKKDLAKAESQFLKEVTQKLSEQASEISKQSYQVSELTSRHLMEIVTGYSFESESTNK